MRSLFPTLLLFLGSPAFADDADSETEDTEQSDETNTEDSEQSEKTNSGYTGVGGIADDVEALAEVNAWDLLGRIPPEISWDFGLQLTYGEIGYFRELTSYAGPTGGMGLQGSYGKHANDLRYGLKFGFTLEGPVPIYMSAIAEVLPSVDLIKGKALIGAAVGPAIALNSEQDGDITLRATGVMAVRMGYSQGWTKVGQRMFIVLEPRVRWIDGRPSYSTNLIVGKGSGR